MKIIAPILLAICIAFGAGCARTVTPVVVKASQASYDGTNQNSGFVGFAGGQGLITPHARDRYNVLVEIYGKGFIPPLVHDAGITATSSNLFMIDGQHLVNFATMNRWRKQGRPAIQ